MSDDKPVEGNIFPFEDIDPHVLRAIPKRRLRLRWVPGRLVRR